MPPIKHWYYKTEYSDKSDDKQITNQMQGWELVNVLHDPTRADKPFVYWFKRPQ